VRASAGGRPACRPGAPVGRVSAGLPGHVGSQP
jgi:hypothetical protein